ncbi:TetR family transcriptional regulator [Streptococcus chenjunshii]|uniref:TetR family transcriptional regulator n=1 Tax=Streptococcus chenjunshii TaxID=2173853 RepID=A0A372KLB0_9STRE|nr:TetR family transcriptional regulator [Streptococcus chenjunshii]AXQ77764.1 TetR family transcriptional regulator [Streptococcus chenjunshii]RFU50486.1 TetR family transcriptional regulator [Streptococcus chenjunshii]RFU52714.1 TetR family transcriptional regulator [Streptococcus chenjunshii]
MDYFEKKMEQIFNRFSFSLAIYKGNVTKCEKCYQESLKELDGLFLCDEEGRFKTELKDSVARFKERLYESYVGG